MRLGVRAALVGTGVVEGDVEVKGDLIDAVGVQPSGSQGLAAPGFLDVQVNGFAGVDFLSAGPEDYGRVGAALAATGVTAYQPTLISSPEHAYTPALEAIGASVGTPGPRILGAHLEGPFLSSTWAGAHDPGHLLPPDPDLMDRLRKAGPVTHVTLAPELPGALDLVSSLAAAGVIVSIGHTDADAGAAHAAFNRGARAITHLYNAHRRWQARDPGPAGVALSREDVTVTAILDNVHLAPDAWRPAFLAARGRFAAVTDAIQAAGRGEGTYELGDRTVRVVGDEVRLEDGTLAGSVLTMDRAVRNLVAAGIPVAEAVGAATRAPALLIGRHELGSLRPGGPADVVVLDDRLEVVRTLVKGQEAFGPG
jgi:N-acetylglucosamine-6-phosphate deacetylase